MTQSNALACTRKPYTGPSTFHFQKSGKTPCWQWGCARARTRMRTHNPWICRPLQLIQHLSVDMDSYGQMRVYFRSKQDYTQLRNWPVCFNFRNFALASSNFSLCLRYLIRKKVKVFAKNCRISDGHSGKTAPSCWCIRAMTSGSWSMESLCPLWKTRNTSSNFNHAWSTCSDGALSLPFDKCIIQGVEVLSTKFMSHVSPPKWGYFTANFLAKYPAMYASPCVQQSFEAWDQSLEWDFCQATTSERSSSRLWVICLETHSCSADKSS